MPLTVSFDHGLGDCAHFAAHLVLAKRRGHEIVVACNADKAVLFKAAGCETISLSNGSHARVPWHDFYWGRTPEWQAPLWKYNKAAVNISVAPMPHIGSAEERWDEFCNVQFSPLQVVPSATIERVGAYLAALPRPLFLLHTIGNTAQRVKRVSDGATQRLYDRLLDDTGGTLVLLDWDNRVPRLNSWRVRHLTDDWHFLSVEELIAACSFADLLIGVDSGPLHLAGLFGVPTVAVWPAKEHYFATYLVPRPNQVSLVSSHSVREHLELRGTFNLREFGGVEVTGDDIADAALALLRPRYLPENSRGADAMLQQWVLDWERGTGSPLTARVDRHSSFDRLFLEIRRRFSAPRIVETGCMRAAEDWRGAGYSTYLLGVFVSQLGGSLHSVDINREFCDFAARETARLRNVHIHCADSIAFLKSFPEGVDVAYLDSWDTYVPGFAQHALAETSAILPRLNLLSLIIFDDTVHSSGAWHGKGEIAVPWLLSKGWRIFYSGHQTILERA